MTKRLDAVLAAKRLPGLDGLRALAAGLVMIFHGRERHILPKTGWYGHMHGQLGVTLFFVLSGFLLTHLMIREHQRTGTISFRGFYLRRTLRIWPAYYVFLAVAFVFLNWPSTPWPPQALASAVAFYHNYYLSADWPARATTLTHTWSISVEEQFYLLWPVVCLWLFARGHRSALRSTAVLIGGVLVWRILAYYVLHLPEPHLNFSLDSRFDSLAIGGLLALACTSDRFRVWASRSARWAWAPLLVVLAIHWVYDQPGAFSIPWGLTIVPLLMALLIVQLIQLSTQGFWSWLEHPIMRYLGRISFGLYLYHETGEQISWYLRNKGILSIWGPRQFLVAAAFAMLIASVSYYAVELPFLRLKDRLSSTNAEQSEMRQAA